MNTTYAMYGIMVGGHNIVVVDDGIVIVDHCYMVLDIHQIVLRRKFMCVVRTQDNSKLGPCKVGFVTLYMLVVDYSL